MLRKVLSTFSNLCTFPFYGTRREIHCIDSHKTAQIVPLEPVVPFEPVPRNDISNKATELLSSELPIRLQLEKIIGISSKTIEIETRNHLIKLLSKALGIHTNPLWKSSVDMNDVLYPAKSRILQQIGVLDGFVYCQKGRTTRLKDFYTYPFAKGKDKIRIIKDEIFTHNGSFDFRGALNAYRHHASLILREVYLLTFYLIARRQKNIESIIREITKHVRTGNEELTEQHLENAAKMFSVLSDGQKGLLNAVGKLRAPEAKAYLITQDKFLPIETLYDCLHKELNGTPQERRDLHELTKELYLTCERQRIQDLTGSSMLSYWLDEIENEVRNLPIRIPRPTEIPEDFKPFEYRATMRPDPALSPVDFEIDEIGDKPIRNEESTVLYIPSNHSQSTTEYVTSSSTRSNRQERIDITANISTNFTANEIHEISKEITLSMARNILDEMAVYISPYYAKSVNKITRRNFVGLSAAAALLTASGLGWKAYVSSEIERITNLANQYRTVDYDYLLASSWEEMDRMEVFPPEIVNIRPGATVEEYNDCSRRHQGRKAALFRRYFIYIYACLAPTLTEKKIREVQEGRIEGIPLDSRNNITSIREVTRKLFTEEEWRYPGTGKEEPGRIYHELVVGHNLLDRPSTIIGVVSQANLFLNYYTGYRLDRTQNPPIAVPVSPNPSIFPGGIQARDYVLNDHLYIHSIRSTTEMLRRVRDARNRLITSYENDPEVMRLNNLINQLKSTNDLSLIQEIETMCNSALPSKFRRLMVLVSGIADLEVRLLDLVGPVITSDGRERKGRIEERKQQIIERNSYYPPA